MKVLDVNDIAGLKEIGYYFQHTKGRRLSEELHAHKFYEMFFVVSGNCVHCINGIERELHVGSLVMIVPGAEHKFTAQSENADIMALSAAPREIQNLFGFYKQIQLPEASSITELSNEQINILIHIGNQIFCNEAMDYTLLNRMLLNQIFLFCINPPKKKLHLPEHFVSVLGQMQKQELAAEGLQAFLRLSGYSHSQLCRIIKKNFGLTPTEYINRIRLNHAYKLIVDSDMNYETICMKVGFESYSYFCKLIRKSFGCSVSRLRKGNYSV